MGTNALSEALSLAERGLRVFPLIPGGKTPIFKGWQDLATFDKAIITKWFNTEYPESGVGVATGRGILAVDADVKKGAPGLASLELMEMMGADLGFVVSTPSGGRHAYFRVTDGQPVRNPVKTLADFPGIDIRGDGGYVAAPGTPGYAVISADPTPEAPDWLLTAVRARRKAATEVDPSVPLDDEAAIQRAIHWLQNSAKAAVEGERNIRAFEVVCMVRDFGLSGDTALLVVDQHWNHNVAKVESPLGLDELELVVDSAYKGNAGNRFAGSKSALAEFEVVEILERPESPAVGPKRNLFLLSFKETCERAHADPLPPLIEGVYNQDTFSVMYGPSNSGKTFVALDQSYAIATGDQWNGRDVAQGAVVYIAAEGGHGITKRIVALDKHHSPASEPPLAVIPCPVDMLKSKADPATIVELATAFAASTGHPLRLIVIDTLSRALAGGDEHSPVDMGLFIRNIDQLRLKANCAVLVIHHTGKDAAKGARGWSGLRAAIDTEIEILETHVVHCEKQRDMEFFEDIAFKLETVPLFETANGKTVTSAVCRLLTAAELEFITGKVDVPPQVQDYLDTLTAMIADGAESVSAKGWDEAYSSYLKNAGRQPVQARSTQRYRTTLIESGWVTADRTGRTIQFGLVDDG